MRSPYRAVASLLALLAVAPATVQARSRSAAARPARPQPEPPPESPPVSTVGTAPVLAPAAPPEPLATVSQVQAALQLMRDKGLITPTEYEEALAGRAVPVAAPMKPVLAPKWETTLYGFVEADAIIDSSQSLTEVAGTNTLARPDTYAGQHGRFEYSVRNSRLGFRVRAPEFYRLNASAVVEMDFLGNQAPNASELVISTSGLLRLRHVNLQIETPYIDLLIGQSWQLFGWQPYFHPGAVSIPGIAGNVFSRAAQIRLSHRFRTNPVSVDVAVSLARAPQRDSIDPDGQAGLRIVFNNLRGLRTIAATQTSVDSAAIGVSATLRRFSLPEFVQNPQNSVSTAGWGVSVDALFPIIAVPDRRAWALTLHGSFVRGAGIADSFTGLTGGVSFPALPLGGTYNSNIDRGLALFDKNGILGTVDWQAFLVGLQFYLPPQGRIFLISNFSQMNSDNAQNFGEPSQVFTQSRLLNASLLVDATASLRFGVEYSWLQQTFVDEVVAQNHRAWLSGYFLF